MTIIDDIIARIHSGAWDSLVLNQQINKMRGADFTKAGRIIGANVLIRAQALMGEVW